MPNHPIRYLNEAALDGLGLGMGEIVDILEALFREKASQTQAGPEIMS